MNDNVDDIEVSRWVIKYGSNILVGIGIVNTNLVGKGFINEK